MLEYITMNFNKFRKRSNISFIFFYICLIIDSLFQRSLSFTEHTHSFWALLLIMMRFWAIFLAFINVVEGVIPISSPHNHITLLPPLHLLRFLAIHQHFVIIRVNESLLLRFCWLSSHLLNSVIGWLDDLRSFVPDLSWIRIC